MHLRTLTESEHRGALLSFKVGLLLNELLSRTCAWLHFTVIWSETLKCFLDHFVLENVFVLIYFSNLRHTVMEKPGSDVWAAFLACVSLISIRSDWAEHSLVPVIFLRGFWVVFFILCDFYLVWKPQSALDQEPRGPLVWDFWSLRASACETRTV